MRSIPLALAACLSLMLAESMIAKDVMKPPVSIVPGGYTVANCTQQAARHYGPNGRNVFIKIDQGEAVFHGLKERAGDKTPRYKLKNGKLEFQAPFLRHLRQSFDHQRGEHQERQPHQMSCRLHRRV